MREFNLILMFCLYGVITLKAGTAANETGITSQKTIEELAKCEQQVCYREESKNKYLI